VKVGGKAINAGQYHRHFVGKPVIGLALFLEGRSARF